LSTNDIGAKYMSWISICQAYMMQRRLRKMEEGRCSTVRMVLSDGKASIACAYVRTQQRRVRAAHIQASIRSVKAWLDGLGKRPGKNDEMLASLSFNDCISRGRAYHSMTAS